MGFVKGSLPRTASCNYDNSHYSTRVVFSSRHLGRKLCVYDLPSRRAPRSSFHKKITSTVLAVFSSEDYIPTVGQY